MDDIDMESRKVQAVGSSTLTISLPKDWVKSQQIKKGDRVLIMEEGKSIRLTPESSAGIKNNEEIIEYVINADLCREPGMLERVIVGNYVLGREKWTVKSQKRLRSEQHKEIRDVSWRLIGVGIIEETANTMSLQCSLDPSKYPLKDLVKRLCDLGAIMFNESIEALIKNDKQLAEDVIKREDDADMIYWLCLKIILSIQLDHSMMEKAGVKNPMEHVGYRLITKDLESIADLSEDIAQNVLLLISDDIKIPKSLLDAISTLANNLQELYNKAINALLNLNFEEANKAINMREAMKKAEINIEKIILKEIKDPNTLLIIRNIIYDIQNIAELLQTISVITINRYLEYPSDLCKQLE